jgi:hypothetical protein
MRILSVAFAVVALALSSFLPFSSASDPAPPKQLSELTVDDLLEQNWRLAQQEHWDSSYRAAYLLEFCQIAVAVHSQRYPHACQDSFEFAEQSLAGCERGLVQIKSVIALWQADADSAASLLRKIHSEPACIGPDLNIESDE